MGEAGVDQRLDDLAQVRARFHQGFVHQDGRREQGARFLDALQLFTRLVNIGDVRSLATHPASTTHRQLSPAELDKAGVGEDTVRLSIGIEHIDDLKADLDQALAAL